MAVNLSPVGGVAAQFFTNTGAVLTGGKLFTYAAGTTTPAAAYTNSTGGTAWTNPIVLDAAGRVSGSGEIWLTDGINYKFVLKDSNDVLIATYDNISGINSNFVSYTNSQEIQTATSGQTVFTLTTMQYQVGTNSLSVFVDGVNQYGPGAQYAYTETSSTSVTFVSGLHVGAEVKFTSTQQQGAGAIDASQVSYDPPFTGSVITNVEAKLGQSVSVMDFGAVCNGIVDDTAAVQAAVNYCLTDPLRPISLIVPGQCKLTASINIDQTVSVTTLKLGDFRIIGQGKMPGFYTTTPIVMFSATANHTVQSVSSNISFEGIVFDNSDRTVAAFVTDGAYIQVKFQNCRFNRIKCMNTSGINTFSYSFLACEMRNWDGDFFNLQYTTSNDITFSNCYFNGGYNCVVLGISQTFNFIDNTAESLQGRPISISGGRDILITGNYFEANRSALGQAYEVQLASGAFALSGCVVQANLFYLSAGQVTDANDYAVNYGQPVSATSVGNWCAGKLSRTVSPTLGSFMSIGDADNQTNTAVDSTVVLTDFQGKSLALATTGYYQQINNYNVQTVAVTKAFGSDLFNAASTTDSAILWQQPAQSLLLNVVMVNELLFVAPSMTDLDITVGDSSDNDGILSDGMNLTADALNTKYKNRGVYWNGGAVGTEYYTPTVKDWSGYATSTGANLNTLTAGQVTFYFTYRSL